MASFEEKKTIVSDNIDKIDAELRVCLEKRVGHISEKTEIISGLNKEAVFDGYNKLFTEKTYRNIVNGALEDNYKYLECVADSISFYDSMICIEKLGTGILDDPASQEPQEQFKYDTIAYLKNSLTDIAFETFSPLLNDARVMYGDSFTDICESVYYSRVPYCILPLENSEDGRLTGFGNMIRKYELKIVLTCSVESSGGRTTKFALLKRDTETINCPENICEGSYLELGFNFGHNNKLHRVIEAAVYFGYELNKIDSFPVYYSDKEYYFDVVFKGNGDHERFIGWLELEVPRYEILGAYKHIKSND